GFLTGYGLLPAHATAPAAPINLTVAQVPPAQGGDTKLLLSWTNPTPNDGTLIKIERSSVSGTTGFAQVAQIGPTQTSFTDTGLTPITHYWYRIRATNQAGDAGSSNVGDAFTRLAAARASVTNVTSIEVDLSWTATGNNGYRVERSTDPAFGTFTLLATLPSNQTIYPDTT